MKKLFLIIAVIFSTTAYMTAQTKSDSEWRRYSLAGDELSIEVPIAKTGRSFGQTDSRYDIFAENTYFYIFITPHKNADQQKTIFDFIKGYKTEKDVLRIGNLLGERTTFLDEDGFYHTILTVQTETHLYIFQTISETEKNLSTERFFSSIQLVDRENPPLKSINELVPKLISFEEAFAENFKPQSNVATQPTVIPKSDASYSSIKIQSKPRAEYTDLARFYLITGRIQLRVTFQPNGEVGEIKAVNKLPFGLTAKTIQAAKKIKFVPATQNGKAVAETKTIEYSFTIY